MSDWIPLAVHMLSCRSFYKAPNVVAIPTKRVTDARVSGSWVKSYVVGSLNPKTLCVCMNVSCDYHGPGSSTSSLVLIVDVFMLSLALLQKLGCDLCEAT